MPGRQYRIGTFTLHPHRQLLAGDIPVPLGRKALEILSVLAEAEGNLVTKDELMAAVWQNVTIEENAIQVQISALRKFLGESAGHLQTVRSLGYRLTNHDGNSSNPLPANGRGTVAVLPFVNLTGLADFDFLGESIAEELINRLTQISDFYVPSRTSCFAFKGHNGDVRQIARELNVEAIVEGCVRSSGNTVRITVQLADAITGYCRWSESYDRKIIDTLMLEDELADQISSAVIQILIPKTAKPTESAAIRIDFSR